MCSKIIVALLLVIVCWCSFIAGIEYEEVQANKLPPDVELGIKFMKEARWSHQQFIDNPDKLYLSSGSLNHHVYCVLKYDYIINLLEEVSNGE